MGGKKKQIQTEKKETQNIQQNKSTLLWRGNPA